MILILQNTKQSEEKTRVFPIFDIMYEGGFWKFSTKDNGKYIPMDKHTYDNKTLIIEGIRFKLSSHGTMLKYNN